MYLHIPGHGLTGALCPLTTYAVATAESESKLSVQLSTIDGPAGEMLGRSNTSIRVTWSSTVSTTKTVQYNFRNPRTPLFGRLFANSAVETTSVSAPVLVPGVGQLSRSHQGAYESII
jgi:hypothetical protein